MDASSKSKDKTKYDLTQGNILSKLLLVSLPIMGTQLVTMTYNLVDMFWLGRIGSDALAASGTAGPFTWLSMAFLFIGRVGAEIGVSQSLGEGNREAAKQYGQTAIMLSVVLGLVFGTIIAVFRHPMIAFFGYTEENIVYNAEAYLGIVAIGVPFTYLSAVITGIFNASGNSRTPFYANAVGILLNIVADPFFIFTLDMGVIGAAVATVLSQIIVFTLLALAIKKHRHRPFVAFKFFEKPNYSKVRQIFKWSTPVCLESLLFTLLTMVTSRFQASFGAYAMAMGRVGSQIESLTWLLGGGFGTALTAFVGQNYGAGRLDRMDKGVGISAIAMSLYGLLVSLLLFFAGQYLFAIFLPDPEIVPLSILYMRILSLCQIPQCLEAVAASAFKGSGRTIPPSLVSIVSNIVRVPLAWVLSRTSLGLYGVYLGISLSAVLRGVWVCVWYLIDKRKARLRRQATPSTETV